MMAGVKNYKHHLSILKNLQGETRYCISGQHSHSS